MDPNKKIIELSVEELTSLGYLGDNVAPGIRKMVEKVLADPVRLDTVTCFMVDCMIRSYPARAPRQDAAEPPAFPTPPTPPTLSDASTLFSLFSNNSDAFTVVTPDLISKYEMTFWYHGISGDPPPLLWRSDFEVNHFPVPSPGARFFKIPTKTAHGVIGTPLNAVWETVAPEIVESLKAHGLKYSALQTVRFAIVEDGKEEYFGPVVVWIAVPPTNAGALRDATPDILHILADAQITDVVVEWYEGSIKRLDGPPLISVKDNTSPTFGLNHPFNPGLGIPIARQSDDSQGTLTFLFREVKTSDGEPSKRILGLTNKHVASLDTKTPYEFDGTNPQHILVCGDRRLARAIVDIEAAVNMGFRDAVGLAGELEALEAKTALGAANDTALRRKRAALEEKKIDNATLKTLFDEVKAGWEDADARRFGIVDWAPEISVGVGDRRYTRDIATFTVDEAKLVNFERNVVDLGNQYSARQLENLFWPVAAVRDGKNIPDDLQLPITRVLPHHLVTTPDTEDKNGEPLYIVAKYGNTTNLTLGRYSEMKAYTCTDLGIESQEVAVFNYNKTSGDFSDHGDSGSLIFTGNGDALAILHSGMPHGMHSHVTYGTPIYWVIEQIRGKYPFAEFLGIAI